MLSLLIQVGLFVAGVASTLTATQSSSSLTLKNNRLTAVVSKSGGTVSTLTLDGQDLLGPRSGAVGQGPYLDCVCVPSGQFTPGSVAPTFKLITGTDSTGTAYGGIMMQDIYPSTGQVFQQYWFLRDGETGIHMFSRLQYSGSAKIDRGLQEFRTLYRHNTPMWTHLYTNSKQHAPLPSSAAYSSAKVVQDATWSFAATPNDNYVKQASDYFTKYTFSSSWRSEKVHGLYADGSKTGGVTFGAWMVMNTQDTYFGGPLHSDLRVDGIVYNYMVSNHHGEGVPNITAGFDRTFGPAYLHFNKGFATLDASLADAQKLASVNWNAAFYDSIAPQVPGYVPTGNRGTFTATVTLPAGAKNPIAVLSATGETFQDNSRNPKALQYWGEIDASGSVTIPRVKADTYRLTVYADGIFGEMIHDGVQIRAGQTTTRSWVWTPEANGTEIWRIGTPDKSAGEFRHGNTPDANHPLHFPEYTIYWGAYNYVADFPNGVNYTIGVSNPAKDWNYIHWSQFGTTPGSPVNPPVTGPKISDWTINFQLTAAQVTHKRVATFTVQLAGAKTAAGNTDNFNATQPWSNMPLTAIVNNAPGMVWTIPYYHSSSCGVRSAVQCYQTSNQYQFDPSLLKAGWNKIVLRLPLGGTDYESAVLPTSLYVQYDALRLEIA